jgi:hypothetical protein
MKKSIVFLLIILPFTCLAQVNISGRVINQADGEPVSSASIFLSNATIGTKTSNDGSFTLNKVKTGKYNLVVSIIGFESYHQVIIVNNIGITLPDIHIIPKTISLMEVKIKPQDNANRQRNIQLFINEFIGTSALARECKLINPDMLDVDFDETTNTLTASSVDFLVIENRALGYRLKYLLTDFYNNRNYYGSFKTHFEGSVLFEEIKGTPAEEKRWKKNREEVYENSPMHFLRSVITNQVEEEGFRVFQYANEPNPERPADDLIAAKINQFTKLKTGGNKRYTDSLSYWIEKSKLDKTYLNLRNFFLNQSDILKPTDVTKMYALNCEMDGLHVTYNKDRHFSKSGALNHLNEFYNTETSLITFNTPYALVDNNGGLVDPNSLSYSGAWTHYRVAELLPVDYEPLQRSPAAPTAVLAEEAMAKLKNYAEIHINEKAYLHFDKPYYAAGDTVYFKAYITQGDNHEPTRASGVLHVDFINTADKIDRSIKLKIADGVAWGDIALPDSLPKGNYRIRAYTNWMRNDGDDNYFEQTIPIGSTNETRVFENSTAKKLNDINVQADIQFFPEGGRLINGVKSKIAFKAILPSGLGGNITGEVLDNDDKKVTEFTSVHLGMGYFYLTPQQGKTYKAKVAHDNGAASTINLPIAEKKGIVLSIDNDSIPKATARIEASKAYFEEHKNQYYTLLIWSGGVITPIACRLDKPVVQLDVLKRRLHTGIAKVTLFSIENEPLAERLIFVQNYNRLSLNVNTDKTNYLKREQVNISVNVQNRTGDAAEGHFSVAVTDAEKVKIDENDQNSIFAGLLLTSDLKGYIEQPNYYFNQINAETTANLDLVMLTHGYRRFEWKPILTNTYPQMAYQPESGLSISGIVKNIWGNPVNKGLVSLLPRGGGQTVDQQTGSDGSFSFNNLMFNDSTRFILQAVTAKNGDNTVLTFKNDLPGPIVMANNPGNKNGTGDLMTAYIDNSKRQREGASKFNNKTINLKEVKIKTIKRNDNYRSSALGGPGGADIVIRREELERLNLDIGNVMLQKFHGHTAGYVLVDGVPGMNPTDLNIRDIETIELFYGPSAAIYGVQGGHGVLVITTRQGGGLQAKDIPSKGILPITVAGFYKARAFYNPKYDGRATNQPDLRSTIYWNPEVITGKDGKANFSFFNADGTGKYRVIIEGIGNDGNIGRQVYTYLVN